MKEEQFRDYLTTEKKAAHNTANAYVRDVKHFEEFLSLRGTDSLCGAINADVIAYLLELKNQGRRKSTIKGLTMAFCRSAMKSATILPTTSNLPKSKRRPWNFWKWKTSMP